MKDIMAQTQNARDVVPLMIILDARTHTLIAAVAIMLLVGTYKHVTFSYRIYTPFQSVCDNNASMCVQLCNGG